jgi:uncharacterized membrane protein (DUF485 family)
MDANQAPDVSAWRVACAGTAFTALKLERLRFVRVLLVVYLASYLGLAVLCGFAALRLRGFARQLAGVKVLGPLNLGYLHLTPASEAWATLRALEGRE